MDNEKLKFLIKKIKDEKLKNRIKEELSKEKDYVSPTESISSQKTSSNPVDLEKEASFNDGLEKIAFATGIDADYIKGIIKESANFSDLLSLKNEGKISQEELNKAKNYSKDKIDDLIKKVQKNNAIDATTNESMKKKVKNKIKDKKRDLSPDKPYNQKVLSNIKSSKGQIFGQSMAGGSIGAGLGHLYDKNQDKNTNKGKIVGGLAGTGLGAGTAIRRLAKNAAVRGMAEHYNNNEAIIKDVDNRYGEETKDIMPPDVRRKMREFESGSNKNRKQEPSNKEKLKKILNKNPTASGAGLGGLGGSILGGIKGKIKGENIASSAGKGMASGIGLGAGAGFAKKMLK